MCQEDMNSFGRSQEDAQSRNKRLTFSFCLTGLLQGRTGPHRQDQSQKENLWGIIEGSEAELILQVERSAELRYLEPSARYNYGAHTLLSPPI